MPQENQISPEIVAAIISLVGVVASSLIAWFVSRSAANKEIEKLRLTWQHDDIVSSDDEFAEMVAAVARYLHRSSASRYAEASAKIAAIRSKESGRLGELLDSLYDRVSSGNIQSADDMLSKVIEEKRHCKSSNEARRPNGPN